MKQSTISKLISIATIVASAYTIKEEMKSLGINTSSCKKVLKTISEYKKHDVVNIEDIIK